MTRWDGQTERFYFLRVAPFEIRPELDPGLLAAEGVGEIRWWAANELAAATDVVFAPRRLPELLRTLLADGPPPEPLDVGV